MKLIKRIICWIVGHRWQDVTGISTPYVFTMFAVYKLDLGQEYYGYKIKQVCGRCHKVIKD